MKYIFILSAWDAGFKVVVFDWLFTFNVKLVKIINNLNIFLKYESKFFSLFHNLYSHFFLITWFREKISHVEK